MLHWVAEAFQVGGHAARQSPGEGGQGGGACQAAGQVGGPWGVAEGTCPAGGLQGAVEVPAQLLVNLCDERGRVEGQLEAAMVLVDLRQQEEALQGEGVTGKTALALALLAVVAEQALVGLLQSLCAWLCQLLQSCSAVVCQAEACRWDSGWDDSIQSLLVAC